MNDSQPFYTMTPDLVIDAVESQGWLSDYRILELNSYDNPNVYILTQQS